MKAVKIFAVLLVTMFVILWVRGGDGFDIRRILPLVNEKPAIFQWGGVTMIGLLYWGIARLNRSKQAEDGGTTASYDDRFLEEVDDE